MDITRKKRNPVDRKILHYYTSQFSEADRLASGPTRLELLRTLDVLERLLPPRPAVVLDIGGAAGTYSAWMIQRGYEVHLIDPVPRHIQQAQAAFASLPDPKACSATVGHAGDLGHGDASVDVTLLMGPLYHLTARGDRLDALGEARRVLRPGGLFLGVGISRFASLIDGLNSGYLRHSEFANIVSQDLLDGQHRNPTDRPEYWTSAFFHHPRELEAEVRQAGFRFERLIGIEGPAWAVDDLEGFLSQGAFRTRLMKILRSVESDASLLGISPHLMAVAYKPETD